MKKKIIKKINQYNKNECNIRKKIDDNVLFVNGDNTMSTEFKKIFFKNILELQIKTKGKKKIDREVQKIIDILKNKKLNSVFFLNNSTIVNRLVEIRNEKKMNFKIIANHQKNYIRKENIKYLSAILEYSLSLAKSMPNYDKNYESKYIMNYMPAYIDNKKLDNLLNKKTKNYIFSGGDNQRDFITLIEVFKRLNYDLIIATNVRCFKKCNSKIEGNIKGSVGRNINKNIKICNDKTGCYNLDNLPKNIKIYNNITVDEYLELLAGCKIFILPINTKCKCKKTIITGYTSIAEALVLNKPIITTKNNGLQDSIINNTHCLSVNDGNINDYVKKIKELYENKKLYNKISRNIQKIGKERRIENYIEFVKKICKKYFLK